MLEELVFLRDLQSIDNKLMEIEAEKGDLPEQLKHLNQIIEEHEQLISKTEKQILELVEERRSCEKTIAEANEQLKKSQNTIYSVKTTKEYDAISLEIEQVKSTVEENEKTTLSLLTKEEEASQLLTELNEKISEVKSDFNVKNSEMAEQTKISSLEEDELIEARKEMVSKLKKPVVAHYERIREIRDGVGISTMTDGACGYCSSLIPPQRQVEVRRGDGIILCEVCGVYLVSSAD